MVTCIPGVFLRNKSINFFIVLVLHRGQNSNAASRRKSAVEWRARGGGSEIPQVIRWGKGEEEERLQLKSVKRVAEKLPGKQLASHVLWPLHSRRF